MKHSSKPGPVFAPQKPHVVNIHFGENGVGVSAAGSHDNKKRHSLRKTDVTTSASVQTLHPRDSSPIILPPKTSEAPPVYSYQPITASELIDPSAIKRTRVIEEMYRINERTKEIPLEERQRLFQIAIAMDAPKLARKLVAESNDLLSEEMNDGLFLTINMSNTRPSNLESSVEGSSNEDEKFCKAFDEVERIRKRLLDRANGIVPVNRYNEAESNRFVTPFSDQGGVAQGSVAVTETHASADSAADLFHNNSSGRSHSSNGSSNSGSGTGSQSKRLWGISNGKIPILAFPMRQNTGDDSSVSSSVAPSPQFNTAREHGYFFSEPLSAEDINARKQQIANSIDSLIDSRPNTARARSPRPNSSPAASINRQQQGFSFKQQQRPQQAPKVNSNPFFDPFLHPKEELRPHHHHVVPQSGVLLRGTEDGDDEAAVAAVFVPPTLQSAQRELSLIKRQNSAQGLLDILPVQGMRSCANETLLYIARVKFAQLVQFVIVVL
jgi:hypothetical protein